MVKNYYKKGEMNDCPWGKWEVIDSDGSSCIKKITVNPKQILSLQMHNHRNEYWKIIKGIAKVTNGEKIFELPAGDSTFIPLKNKHRIENKTNKNLIFIEVQTGEILDENDVIRFEDNYGRI